ncbi:MAG: prolyl oligopeptidase family serine peptidase [Candidatus Aminicenantes bacterium]|nr:prolyl oligopeptidase family serine peptidase [Candidatus Aminicenantes bacterium]
MIKKRKRKSANYFLSLLLFYSVLITLFVLTKLGLAQSAQEKPTYVESLFQFFRRGKVIELPDFPKTEIFKQFLLEEAKHKGIEVEELKSRMKQKGITSYLLELLRQRHISPVEFANLMDLSWIQAFQMAYSSGALTLSEESLQILRGQITPTIQKLRQDKEIIVKEIAYRSSVDNLYPLYAEVAYNPKGKNMPVIVYQHGDYPGTRLGTVPAIYELAKKGLFGLSVSKRGRDGSAGKGDGFGKEIYDIYDAVEYVKNNYAPYIDSENINITGGSGGGMDTFAAIVHFPDYFRVAAPFVAPPDLDHWFREPEPTIKILEQMAKSLGGQYAGSWSLFSQIIEGIGGLPSQVPDKYLARNWVLGAINNPYTLIHVFWDAEDGAAPSITIRSQAYLEETKKFGFTNIHLHFSQRGDKLRFLHWGVADNFFVWHHFLPVIMSRSHPAPILAEAGRMVVLGFVKTKKFLIWLGEGDDAVARVDYSLSSHGATFNFRRLSSDPNKRGKLIYENPDATPFQVLINDRSVIEKTTAKKIEVSSFGLDDRVLLRKLN